MPFCAKLISHTPVKLYSRTVEFGFTEASSYFRSLSTGRSGWPVIIYARFVIIV